MIRGTETWAPIGSAATKPGKSGLLDGAAFIVEANQTFALEVASDTAYLCTYE